MTSQPSRHRSKWSLDFGSRQCSYLPPGFSSSLPALHAEAARNADPTLKDKRAWDLALGPLKQIPMNAVLMYMSGVLLLRCCKAGVTGQLGSGFVACITEKDNVLGL